MATISQNTYDEIAALCGGRAMGQTIELEGGSVFLHLDLHNDVLTIEAMRSIPERSGLGTKVMNALKQVAHGRGWSITGDPVDGSSGFFDNHLDF